MKTKIKRVKFQPEYKNPKYSVFLESPEGNELYIEFDYTYTHKTYMPLKVEYNGVEKGAKLAWYTSKVENITVEAFLDTIARRINQKYNFTFRDE